MDLVKKCLLIIDVQLGAFDGKKIPTLVNGATALGNIKKLLRKYRAESSPIIYIQDCGDVGGAFEEGTESWRIHPEIMPTAADKVILKRSPSAFDVPELSKTLERQNIRSVMIVGLHSQHCYTNTVLSAIKLGLDVTVVSDAHGTIDSVDKPAAKIVEEQNYLFQSKGANLRPTNEILLL